MGRQTLNTDLVQFLTIQENSEKDHSTRKRDKEIEEIIQKIKKKHNIKKKSEFTYNQRKNLFPPT